MTPLTLGLPSKGRLQEQTLAFLKDCGLALVQDGGERAYQARIPNAPQIEVRLLSASEIARSLAAGELQAGITGEDVMREAAPALAGVGLVHALGFGRADLVVAAPQSWLDVITMADLAEVCVKHRARTGRRLRVATKYLRQTGAFFDQHGIEDYRQVESAGATEGAPAAGAAEVIVDITTTGQTLAANALAVLKDGLILRSQAHLAVSQQADWSQSARLEFERVLEIIEARASAQRWRFVRVLVAPGKREEAWQVATRFRRDADADSLSDEIGFHCPAGEAADAARLLAPFARSPVGVYAPQYLFMNGAESVARFREFLRDKP